MHKTHLKHEENALFKSGKEKTQEIRDYLENKRKQLKQSQSRIHEDESLVELRSPKNMDKSWKPAGTDRMFFSSKRQSFPSRMLGYDDEELEAALARYEEKIKTAEDRYESE
jgi:hypothetical protein